MTEMMTEMMTEIVFNIGPRTNTKEKKGKFYADYIISCYDISNVKRENLEDVIAKLIAKDIHAITMERMIKKVIGDGFFHGASIIEVKTYCLDRLLCKCTFGLTLTIDQYNKIIGLLTTMQLLKLHTSGKRLDDGDTLSKINLDDDQLEKIIRILTHTQLYDVNDILHKSVFF